MPTGTLLFAHHYKRYLKYSKYIPWKWFFKCPQHLSSLLFTSILKGWPLFTQLFWLKILKSLLTFLSSYSLTFSESQKLIKSAHCNTTHINLALCIIIATTLVKFLITQHLNYRKRFPTSLAATSMISHQYISTPPPSEYFWNITFVMVTSLLRNFSASFLVFRALNCVNVFHSLFFIPMFSPV